MCCREGLVPTTLSYSSRVSLSPAVLLKLLVLEEEREMFDRPFSFSLIKGLERGGTKEGRVAVTRDRAVTLGWDRGQRLLHTPGAKCCRRNEPLGFFSTEPLLGRGISHWEVPSRKPCGVKLALPWQGGTGTAASVPWGFGQPQSNAALCSSLLRPKRSCAHESTEFLP